MGQAAVTLARLVVIATLLTSPLSGATSDLPATAPGELALSLEAIREDLSALRFEKALADLDAWLERPGLQDSDVVEALVLRSQAHVAVGDLAAAESDYLRILHVQPGWVPDAAGTPRKAMERFKGVQAAHVGRVILVLDPPDARITVDGREVSAGPESALPLFAGEHSVRAERAGYDPAERDVRIEAGGEQRLELQLVPNARSVLILTDPDDVEVLVDGLTVGRTARLSDASVPAELTVENLPLGEHVIELRKPCFRTELRNDLLAADLLDRSPKRYSVVALVPVRSTLSLVGGVPGAAVRVDGAVVGHLPSLPLEVCPGARDIEVVRNGRVLWRSVESFAELEQREIDVRVRPNAAVFGSDRLPPALAAFEGRFNLTVDLAGHPATDVSTREGWSQIGLPPNTDIALARIPPSQPGAPDAWHVYSPILRRVERLAPLAEGLEPRPWSGPAWGLQLADSRVAGRALVIEVKSGGPAAAAGVKIGDRLLAAGGSSISSASQARSILQGAAHNEPLEFRWASPDGGAHQARLFPTTTPRLWPAPANGVQAALEAAWAVAEAAAETERAKIALGNLALLFSAYGQHDLAVETWRRVRLNGHQGIGQGTILYYLGRDLERVGRRDEAIEAYRGAAASEASAFDDDGPPVGAAAIDRLADLGHAAPGPTTAR